MGLAHEPFPKHVTDILLRDIPKEDIEVKPDGILYLPEIKYRRILNEAFGPGGWGLIPRGPHTISMKTISREYALFCDGRFISQARGEQTYFSEDGLATATEGCKSNALMRCCKDLGIASELWDPVFVQEFKAKEAVQKMTVNTFNGTRKLLWRRKDRKFAYPIAEDDGPGGAPKSNGFGNQSAGAGAKTWVKKT
ncbi:mitochondrial genome maintenance MGM101 [Fimicolochytrium jonesii]|uniref:mitochondrial genome maintenance MGM101 n=1 Tax=Fimicolochytrium jonesii TaxID=1396493 RepID=UPI0022FF0D5B|nr:mitochondrial genome maintenance MGM101 [Fimicolochytrium jonesii]KAI8820473.1 mitochondrial genome maintenance MGM101 [Fimicolochytrium jonesii]